MKILKMKKLLPFAVFLLFSCGSNHLDQQCQPIIQTFFNKIKEHRQNEALSYLLSFNEDINQKDSDIVKLKRVFIDIYQSAGQYIGSELLVKKQIKDDIIVYSYLVKYEKNFYRFIFSFYNPQGTPKTYRFAMDDDVEAELEQSLKLYFYLINERTKLN